MDEVCDLESGGSDRINKLIWVVVFAYLFLMARLVTLMDVVPVDTYIAY